MRRRTRGGSFKGAMSVLALALDALIVYAAFGIAVSVRFGVSIPELERASLATVLPILFLTRLGALYAAGIYRRSYLHPRFLDFSDLLQAWAAGTVILVAAIFFGHLLETSRLVLVYEAVMNVALTFGWRLCVWMVGRRVTPRKRTVFIGEKSDADRINLFLEAERWEHRIVRRIHPQDMWTLEDEEALIIRMKDVTPQLVAKAEGMQMLVLADTKDILLSGAVPAALGGFVVLESSGVRNDRHYLAAKRSMDIIVSLFGLIAAMPLMAAVALLVKFSSPGPAFYTQERVGLGGKRFLIFKFRTMFHGCAGPGLTDVGDRRVTGVGKFLRTWSLDEIPQLLNVLSGNMSIVGPRPEVPEVADTWSEWRRQALKVQPGITGLVQVLGRDELTEEEKERLDIFYAMNRSLEMDLSIIFKTVRTVVKYHGRA